MAVYLPAYCTRRDVKTAADVLQTLYNEHIDSAIQGAVDDIFGLCHRYFHPVDDTRSIDWPNFQSAYPWRIWLDGAELADVTVNVPVVTSGGTVIPANQIFWGNPRYAPPFRYLELDRSTQAAFGVGGTPQRDVSIKGTFGYWLKTRPAGALAANVSSTTVTTITVSDSSKLDAGDTLTVGTERMLVSDTAFTTTTQTQLSGCTTAQMNDNTLGVTDGTQIHAGETLQLDSESMLAVSVTGNNVTVLRAYDGTVLATHTGATVNAPRILTVIRGSFGTTAATHTSADPITAMLVPQQVRELAIAYSLIYVAQKSAAYARAIAEGSTAAPAQGLPVLENRVCASYGRKARQRVI